MRKPETAPSRYTARHHHQRRVAYYDALLGLEAFDTDWPLEAWASCWPSGRQIQPAINDSEGA